MSKLLGYKDIICNMVWSYLSHYAHEKAEKYPVVDEDIVLKRSTGMYISFEAIIKADFHSFRVHGIVDEFGDVQVTSISYDLTSYTEKNDRGEWIEESLSHIHVLLHDEVDLKGFAFNPFYFRKAQHASVWTEKVRREA